jgi:hypothetical protein
MKISDKPDGLGCVRFPDAFDCRMKIKFNISILSSYEIRIFKASAERRSPRRDLLYAEALSKGQAGVLIADSAYSAEVQATKAGSHSHNSVARHLQQRFISEQVQILWERHLAAIESRLEAAPTGKSLTYLKGIFTCG